MDNDTLVFAITQSGETADTLAALREMQAQGLSDAGASATWSAARSPRRPTAASICTPARRSASPRPRPSRRSASTLAMLALYFGRLRHLSFAAGMRMIERLQELPERVRQALQADDDVRRDRREVSPGRQFPLPGPAVQLSDRARRGAEAQGNQLHPRRGLSGRRDEARPDRPGRRAHAQRVPHSARRGLRQGDGQPRRDQGPRRPGDRRRLRGRHAGRPNWPTT